MQVLAIDSNNNTAAADDGLTWQLVIARRRWALAIFIDSAAIAYLFAGVLFVIGRGIGESLPWIFLMALLISAAIPLLTLPSLLMVAQRIDRHCKTNELLSTGLMIGDANDPWSRLVAEQAKQHINDAVARQRWQVLSNGTRGSAVLLASAVTLAGLLIRPATSDVFQTAQNTVATEPASSAAAAAAWLVPPAAVRANDQPDEAGRSIPMDAAAAMKPLRTPGDDFAGGGRADGGSRTEFTLSATANRPQPGEATAASGNGVAAPAGDQTQSSASGRVVGAPRFGKSSVASGSDATNQVGDASVGRGVDPQYRPLIEAYFAR